MIKQDAIGEAAQEIMHRAAIVIPEDYKSGIRKMVKEEENELSRFVLEAMCENWDVAEEDRRAMCADTGLPRYYVKVGNEARVEGGMVAPEIEYSFEPGADWIDITSVHKGGLFGSDYRMLFPGDGIDGIKRFFLDVMLEFGRRGLACQPAIVGVGLGGSKDTAMTIGKQAACLRVVGDRSPDPEVAALEEELMEMGNNIGMGPMGFVGKSMVVDCHVEVAYTHTGGMPMSVHSFCLSSRRAVARIGAGGEVDYRTDPQWFTPYHRRSGVEWEGETPGLDQAVAQ